MLAAILHSLAPLLASEVQSSLRLEVLHNKLRYSTKSQDKWEQICVTINIFKNICCSATTA